MTKPARPRRDRRQRERTQRKAVHATERLARHLPGATPDAPLDVPTSSVVEIKARATPCPQCGGELEIRADRADSTPRGVVRALDLVCRVCHAPRTLWFRLPPQSAN